MRENPLEDYPVLKKKWGHVGYMGPKYQVRRQGRGLRKTYYHGTTRRNLDKMKDLGYLRAPVYVSKSWNVAGWFSEGIGGQRGFDDVILKLEIPSSVVVERDPYYDHRDWGLYESMQEVPELYPSHRQLSVIRRNIPIDYIRDIIVPGGRIMRDKKTQDYLGI